MRYGVVLLIFATIAAMDLNAEVGKEIRPLFTQEAIEIDGHLNEEDWASCSSQKYNQM